MDVTFVEATNGPRNWGKFAVLKFTDDEWKVQSAVDDAPLLAGRGWTRDHVMVVDLQTGEGAFFFPAGIHQSDLAKHAIWVCPMYEHALRAICEGDHDPMKTAPLLDFPDAPFAFQGYRRGGPDSDIRFAVNLLLTAFDDCDFIAVAEKINELRGLVSD